MIIPKTSLALFVGVVVAGCHDRHLRASVQALQDTVPFYQMPEQASFAVPTVVRNEDQQTLFVATCGMDGCSVEELARGRTTIADAPVAELIVARWFGPAQALGEIAGGVSRLLDKPIRVTTVSPLTGIHRIRDLRAMSVSRASLTVPSDFVEAPWPGLPSSSASEGADRGAKWRTLPKSR